MVEFLLFFVFVVALVVLLDRLVTQQMLAFFWLLTGNERLAYLVYALLLFPGTLVHEGSHWLVARLLGVPTGGLSLRPRVRGGQLVLGQVMTARSDPVRQSLIGAAPLVAGCVVIVLVARNIFGVQGPEELLPGGQGFRGLVENVARVARVEDAWLWVYLLFSVSHVMLPSESDRAAWPTLLALLGVLGGAVVLLFGVPTIPEAAVVVTGAVLWALLFAFLVTILVDMPVFLAFWLLNQVLVWGRGGRR